MVIAVMRTRETFASMFQYCNIQILFFVKCVEKGNNTKLY